MVEIYIYTYITVHICMYIRTLLSIYLSKISSRDQENLTTNFDYIYFQNFSVKTKFILGLFIYLY